MVPNCVLTSRQVLNVAQGYASDFSFGCGLVG
jgi:hypothetical protein